MQSSRVRWIVLLVSSTASLALAWFVLRDRASGPVQPGVRFFSPPIEEVRAPTSTERPPSDERTAWLAPERPEDWRYFLPEKSARRIYPITPENNNRYDPWTHFSDLPNQNTRHVWTERPDQEFFWRTNSLGLRDDDELSDPPAELRVLVTGDSHTVGACNNSETFSALLQTNLAGLHPGRRVEVLNAALPGASLYQYAGTLQKFRAFAPQVFVVAVYGGNDISEIMFLAHRFGNIPWQSWTPEQLALQERALKDTPFPMAQCFNMVFNFRCRPQERELMIDSAAEICRQMHETCVARGAAMIVAYIPAACDCEWKPVHEEIERNRAILDLTAEELGLDAKLGRAFIAELTKLQVPVVDMQPVFARESQPPYWRTDLHLNLRGHQLMAERLLPEIEPLLKSVVR